MYVLLTCCHREDGPCLGLPCSPHGCWDVPTPLLQQPGQENVPHKRPNLLPTLPPLWWTVTLMSTKGWPRDGYVGAGEDWGVHGSTGGPSQCGMELEGERGGQAESWGWRLETPPPTLPLLMQIPKASENPTLEPGLPGRKRQEDRNTLSNFCRLDL